MPENLPTPNSGSLAESLGLRSPSNLDVQGQERVISVLAQKYDEMAKELYDLKKEKLLNETQLPPEILEQLGLPLHPPPRLKCGRGARPLLSTEIQEAISKTKNMAAAARYLRVSIDTLKKYAKRHGLWKPNPSIKGVKSAFDPERGKHPLSEILLGKHPDYPVFRIKMKLIRSGVKEEKCEKCGLKEKSLLTGRVPLLLNFMDDNPKNHALDNMKLYCPTCTTLVGRGYIRSGKHHFDVDWLQGAEKDYVNQLPP